MALFNIQLQHNLTYLVKSFFFLKTAYLEIDYKQTKIILHIVDCKILLAVKNMN